MALQLATCHGTLIKILNAGVFYIICPDVRKISVHCLSSHTNIHIERYYRVGLVLKGGKVLGACMQVYSVVYSYTCITESYSVDYSDAAMVTKESFFLKDTLDICMIY